MLQNIVENNVWTGQKVQFLAGLAFDRPVELHYRGENSNPFLLRKVSKVLEKHGYQTPPSVGASGESYSVTKGLYFQDFKFGFESTGGGLVLLPAYRSPFNGSVRFKEWLDVGADITPLVFHSEKSHKLEMGYKLEMFLRNSLGQRRCSRKGIPSQETLAPFRIMYDILRSLGYIAPEASQATQSP